MFAGIIQATAPVISAKMQDGCRKVRIRKPRGWKLQRGQSIAVDGICSTVVARKPTHFDVEYIPESLSKTTAVSFAKGVLVNLERSLTLKDFVDGHLVLGHVDARTRVVATLEAGVAREVTLALPRALSPYVVAHGSIAINGVALTVARRGKATCTVALIPHTIKETNLAKLGVGDVVNVEVDMIARYLVESLKNGRVRRNAKKAIRKED